MFKQNKSRIWFSSKKHKRKYDFQQEQLYLTCLKYLEIVVVVVNLEFEINLEL